MLLQAADAAGYQVLITVDRGVPHHVKLGSKTIAVIVLRSRTNQLEDLKVLAEPTLDALSRIRSGEIVFVELSG